MPGSIMLAERVGATPETAGSSGENPKFWYWSLRDDIPYAKRVILPNGRKKLYVLSARGLFDAKQRGRYSEDEGGIKNPNSGINWFEMPKRLKPVIKYMREDRQWVVGLAGLDLAKGDELYVVERLPGYVTKISGKEVSDIFMTRKEGFERELRRYRHERAIKLGVEFDEKVTSPVKVHIGEEGGLIFSYVSHGMDFDFCWTCCSGRRLAVRPSLAHIFGILRAPVESAERDLEQRFRGRAVGILEARRLVGNMLRERGYYLSTMFNGDAYDPKTREERFRFVNDVLNFWDLRDLAARRIPSLA